MPQTGLKKKPRDTNIKQFSGVSPISSNTPTPGSLLSSGVVWRLCGSPASGRHPAPCHHLGPALALPTLLLGLYQCGLHTPHRVPETSSLEVSPALCYLKTLQGFAVFCTVLAEVKKGISRSTIKPVEAVKHLQHAQFLPYPCVWTRLGGTIGYCSNKWLLLKLLLA